MNPLMALFSVLTLVAIVIYGIVRLPKFRSFARKWEDIERRSKRELEYQRERSRIHKRFMSIKESYYDRTDPDGQIVMLALCEISLSDVGGEELEKKMAEIVESFDTDPIEAEKSIAASLRERSKDGLEGLLKATKGQWRLE